MPYKRAPKTWLVLPIGELVTRTYEPFIDIIKSQPLKRMSICNVNGKLERLERFSIHVSQIFTQEIPS